jgi:hypothetical protein
LFQQRGKLYRRKGREARTFVSSLDTGKQRFTVVLEGD